MWTFRTTGLPNVRGKRCLVDLDLKPASFREVIDAWRFDSSFRAAFNRRISDAPYSAFRWETPPVTTSSISRPFECVVIESLGLDRTPDAATFAEQFEQSRAGVAVFRNLGGDSLLIVPLPMTAHSAYGHLAAFVRTGPEKQRQELWRSVGEAMAKRICDKPVWLNTAGAGVAWLHVRIDDQPKYYMFVPYKTWGDGPSVSG